MASMSVSGVVSGMDWDSMIDEIITNAAKPAQVKVNRKTNLTNKKSLFEEMKVTMNSLQSSLSPLKLPSTYKAKEINIERIDTSGSYKGVLTATVNADAEVNVWDVKVNSLATAQTNRSKQITSSSLASTLNGLSSSTFYVNMGGQKVGIEVNATDTLQTLKSRINNTLKTLDNPLAVTASVVDNKLILKSDDTGLGTRTATETINYRSSGINTLSNISVNANDASSLKITKGSKSYTYGTDFTVANGNEIRWKQYDRSDEVALNGVVNVNYRMAAGDVYENTGTYGTSEAEISGFDMIDKGTLGSRLKIKDSEGNTYTYGKDFTITDNKVVWLEEEESTTNEPASYTVSYSKKTEDSYSVAGVKINPIDAPESYTVSYDKVIEAEVTATQSSLSVLSLGNPNQVSTGKNFPDYTEFKDTYGLGVTSGTTLDFNGSSDNKLEIVVDGEVSSNYSYGTNYTLRKASYGANSDYYGQDHLALEWKSTSSKPTNAYTIRFTHTYSADNTDSSGLEELITAAGTDTASITITGSDGTVYENGTHFDIEDGQIVWKTQSEIIDVTNNQFAELQTKYAEAYESAHGTSTTLNTVTLVDGNGVLRTYVDPDDPSIFTMTADGESYEYGRDYVLRVNDSGTGYRFQWLVEDSDTITDADTVVATYAAHKNISTSSWKAAPAENTDYEFGFTYESESTGSATVNKTDADSTKNVYSLLGLDSLDGITLTITDSSGNTYSGTDYAIDSSGNITWTDQNTDAPSSYTVKFIAAQADITPDSGKTNYDALSSGGATFPKIDTVIGYGFETVDVNGGSRIVRTIDVYNPSSTQDYKFSISLKDDDGNYSVSDDYVYGRDYVIRKSDDASAASTHTLVAFYSRPEVTSYTSLVTSDTDTYGTVDLSGTQHNRPSADYRVSLTRTESNSDAIGLASLISDASGNYANIEITDTSGKTYTYVSDEDSLTDDTFTIVDGVITFKPASETSSRPADGSTYTLYYESFSALTATGTYDYEDSQEVSITVDSGSGNYGGTSLSYEQILKDLSLTSSSSSDTVAEKFADNFTLTDEDGDTYEYGTDFTIIQGSSTDSTNGEHNVMIQWVDGGNTPSGDFTLTYAGRGEGGGESITTAGVQRSAKDTIYPDASNVQTGLYFSFADASDITITDGTNTYNLGTDFTISQSNDGLLNPVISWDSDSSWFDQDTTSATSFTVTVTNSDGTTSSYTGTRAAESDDLTLNLGSLNYYSSSDFDGGTNTITQGNKTFYENEDFIFMDDSDGHAQVYWLNDNSGGTEWFYPNPGTQYTINHTDSSGNTTSYTASRNGSSTLNMADYGMTTANGSLTVQYGSKSGMLLDAEPDYDDDGNAIANTDGHAAIKAEYSIDISDRGNGNYTFNWVTPTLTSRSGLPSIGDELTVEYEYDANTFTITGEAADLLGLNDDVTEAQDAELVVDGETVYRASNDIGADYDNELIKGVTMHLKGTGEVSLDIAHDAEKAVESIQTFVDTYNDLMSWINTRMTESQLDEDTKATVDSDDFRMRWGLLHGNSLLRNTKSQMRSLVSQNFTFSFTQRKSSAEIYGTMAHNGLRSASTLRLRIGTKYVDVNIDPSDTLQTILAKINDDTKGGPMNDIYYDENGNKLQSPLLRASVENDMLVINSTSSDEVTMSGSAAMNALKMNYTYKGLYQIGIETTSDDYGKSGELVFDADEFMTALEDNPDEVQALMMKFIGQFDTWTKSMLNSSASGETSGTLTREIENIQTQIDSINEYLETYQERLDRMEESLRSRYGNTETQLSRLTQQASSIAAILNQLNGTASSSSSSSS